ncbi:hypothetical protein GLOIN_2v1627944 [Rhizophagus irregularis DAOM 181602=DAOM 197198]|uniref:Uncharacterized protein n=1 Tax=Rhizophagus irregularis (strain DAOM 181602 / DAOM 197198 / MUCL 43194) TaxID=747089 RepID=A0A2P4PVI4_RHIID|nr:hypothetical protein GLOIN_2v1633777 [Rhizophagus irregularis DAOM 181602=DAOM 197198]XP_025176236.1 hypothetical protein GLOIN_2v1627944 [Rhizophagus irregularis DAOM 181602=DAOM 197198]POG68769.1 hypothetical protein GLOIN_2v1633777 [Rhizophagus irregularis DAOM 181602=DAOM 197198]POG69370.1 hypothetical protein GLOIN_2v1627944 [Rhizophagus irregularis DAOM 181602=DAOM 197198]|eukprot:XP_025175635.1 hypothetical protein GLOIN_2v1633777 [Rhizophagus irregularis DAOM 181602=DAOM 197198]
MCYLFKTSSTLSITNTNRKNISNKINYFIKSSFHFFGWKRKIFFFYYLIKYINFISI